VSVYEDITDGKSQVLQLQLVAEGRLIGFYRLGNGEKLLIPDELLAALRQAFQTRQEAEERAAELEAQLARYRDQFGKLS
jgi:hypothetical protein